MIASYNPFSFDLHVLSTPPAFTLSQDQTLHKLLINLINHYVVYETDIFVFYYYITTLSLKFIDKNLTSCLLFFFIVYLRLTYSVYKDYYLYKLTSFFKDLNLTSLGQIGREL